MNVSGNLQRRRSRIEVVIAVILCFLISCNPPSNVGSQSTTFDSIVNGLGEQLQKDLIADDIEGSISAAICKDNKIVWSKAFGYSDHATRKLADTSTIYRTGSITKSFTAFLMMQLVEEGIIKLSDPVEMYLPEVKKLIGYSSSTKITFLQLGTHTSGLIREPDLEDAASGPIEQWEQKIIMSIPYTSFQNRPAEKFSYSNIGYGILGLALSRAANKPFQELVKDKIFIPLKMNHSYFGVPAEVASHLAKGMNGGPGDLDLQTPNREHVGRGYKVPNGGIYSTPNDLARFAIAMMGYQNLLRPETLVAMQTEKISGRDDYGVGFFINREQDGNIINHGGAVAGYTAQFAFKPTSHYGIIIMRNYNFGATDLQARSFIVLKELNQLDTVQSN